MASARRGMTLVEVMMALMITSIIGAVTTSIAVALFNAQQSTDAHAENVQAGRMSLAQLTQCISTSRLVTDGDATSMTLWAFDNDDPGVINAEELVRLMYDPSSRTIFRIYLDLEDSIDEATRAALNVTMSLDDATDWNVASGHLIVSRIYDTPIATGVSAVQFHYDEAAPHSGLVAIEATFGDAEQAAVLYTAAALRASATEWIEDESGTAVLVPSQSVNSSPGGEGGS